MHFDKDKFASSMGDKWDKKDKMAMEYESKNSNYRTWLQDTSLLPKQGGLYVSSKIDHIRGGFGEDDHIIVMMGYGPDGMAITGQAAVQIQEDKSSYTTDIIQGTNIEQNVANAIKARLKSEYDDSNSGRQNIPNVVKRNLDAITASIVIQ